MHISDLIEIALAGVERDRVDVASLEPATFGVEGVAGVAAIVSELVHSATDMAEKEQKVRITGLMEPEGYQISIADRGVGMSDQFLEGLNRILENPKGLAGRADASGIYLVAGLAARHGIGVRLLQGSPGVTARVSVPSRLLEASQPALVPEDRSSEIFADRSAVERTDTEAFLESIFAPLRSGTSMQPAAGNVRVLEHRSAAIEEASWSTDARLPTRVPGINYRADESDKWHVTPGEAAVDIHIALTDFDRGRQAAAGSDRGE